MGGWLLFFLINLLKRRFDFIIFWIRADFRWDIGGSGELRF